MLRGKTYLITGSTDGIGRHTVLKLAAAGATVLIHGRNAEKVAQVVQQAKAAEGGGTMSSYTYDLSAFANIEQFADHVKAEHPRIDVLVNNAGIFSQQKRVSDDGIELTWAVNALAPFLLTALLLDRVKDRIVNVGSMAMAHTMDFNNLQQEKGYDGHNAYSVTKLANLMFSSELAMLMKGKGVTVSCVHPGVIATNVLQQGWGDCGSDIETADDVYNHITDKQLEQQTGNWYVGGHTSPQPPIAQDPAARQRLWKLMQQQTGASYDV